MSTTPQDLRDKFTEVSNATAFPDSLLQGYIDETVCFINEDKFGICFDSATCYLSMHFLTIGQQTSNGVLKSLEAGKDIASQSVDKLSVTLDNKDSTDSSFAEADFSSTSYGRRYLTYLERVRTSGFCIV